MAGIDGEDERPVTGGEAPDGTADVSEDGGAPEEDASERDSRWERLRRWRPSAPVVIWAVIAAVLLGPLVWNWGKDNYLWGGLPLGPLTRDPLASKDLLDLELVSSNEHKDAGLHNLFSFEPGGSTGLSRMFSADPKGSAETVHAVVEFAEDHGWTVIRESYDPDDVSVNLEKPYGRRVMSAWVSNGWPPEDSTIYIHILWTG